MMLTASWYRKGYIIILQYLTQEYMDDLFEHSHKLMVDELLMEELLRPELPRGRNDRRHRSAYDLYASSARPRTGTVPLRRGAATERGQGSGARGSPTDLSALAEPSLLEPADATPQSNHQPVCQLFPAPRTRSSRTRRRDFPSPPRSSCSSSLSAPRIRSSRNCRRDSPSPNRSQSSNSSSAASRPLPSSTSSSEDKERPTRHSRREGAP
jgi:hypothetical protein